MLAPWPRTTLNPAPLRVCLRTWVAVLSLPFLKDAERRRILFKINQERKRTKVQFSYQSVCRLHFFGSKEKWSQGKSPSQVKGPVGAECPSSSCIRASCPFLMLTLSFPPPIPKSQQSPENVTTCALCFHILCIGSSP